MAPAARRSKHGRNLTQEHTSILLWYDRDMDELIGYRRLDWSRDLWLWRDPRGYFFEVEEGGAVYRQKRDLRLRELPAAWQFLWDHPEVVTTILFGGHRP